MTEEAIRVFLVEGWHVQKEPCVEGGNWLFIVQHTIWYTLYPRLHSAGYVIAS